MSLADGEKMSQARFRRLQSSIPTAYTIYKDGTTYRAESNIAGGTDYSGLVASTIFNNALAGGGKVLFKDGEYPIDTILNMVSNSALIGESLKAVLKMDDNSNLVGMVKGYNALENVTLANFKIDGNKANQTADGRGIYIRYASNVTVRNMTVADCYKHGIQIYSGGAGEPTDHTLVDGCYVSGCNADGIHATGHAVLTDVRICNNDVENCVSAGTINTSGITVANGNRFVIEGNICDANSGTHDNNAGIQARDMAGTCLINGNICSNGGSQGILFFNSDGITVSNNWAFTNGKSGIYNEGSQRAVITGNHVTNNSNEGIVLGSWATDYSNDSLVDGNICYRNGNNGILVGATADRSTISGNVCRENSFGDTPGVDAGIGLLASYCSVTGNTCSDGQGTPTQKYGIAETGTPNYNVIKGNRCYNHLTAPYIIVGAETVGDGVARSAISADLSGGATTLVTLHTPEAAHLMRATLLYTEASSGDAGIGIEIGKETDRNYYYDGTSEINKAQWYTNSVTLLKNDVAAGDTVTFYSAGGKVGTGEIMLIIDFLTGA